MKKIVLIILITIISFPIFAQQDLRWQVFHKDCIIYSEKILNKIARIDSIITSKATDSSTTLSLWTTDFFKLINRSNTDKYDNLNYILKKKTIPRKEISIYYKLSQDIKTIYIIALAQNQMIPADFYIDKFPYSDKEFDSKPRFVVPLEEYKTFLPDSEYEDILLTAETVLKNNISLEHIENKNHTTYRSVYIGSVNEIVSYDDFDIRNILTNQEFDIPINPKYLSPNLDTLKPLSLDEIFEITCGGSHNHIEGIEISISIKTTREFYDFVSYKSVSKLEIKKEFIGFKYMPCENNSVNKIIWMRWEDFFKEKKDPILEQELNDKLNIYLYNKLIKNI